MDETQMGLTKYSRNPLSQLPPTFCPMLLGSLFADLWQLLSLNTSGTSFGGTR